MKSKKIVFVDIREPQEYSTSHVKGAINLPMSELVNNNPDDSKKFDKGAKLVVYCNSGNRSSFAKDILQKLGYTDVENGINQETVEADYL